LNRAGQVVLRLKTAWHNGTTHIVIAAVYDCTQPGPPRPLKKARDRDGHGTHVAGIIAGAAAAGAPLGPGDEIGLRGMAPRAQLVVYKVLVDDGRGEDEWIIKALDHIAQQNADIAGGLAIH
jgi:subtilisin family serine protease